MTKIQRRAARVSTFLTAAAGVVLAGCGSDAAGPGLNDNSLAPGQAAAVGATARQLEGGSSGTENVLVLVDTSIGSAATKVTYQVTATGTGVAGAVSAPATSLVPSSDASLTGTSTTGPVLDIGYGMRLNARSRSRLVPEFRAARAAYRAAGTSTGGISRSLGVAAPQVGDVISYNVGTGSACDNLVRRGARVVAIGAQSIVVSDTLNPSGGFSTADYQRFAARFDTLVYPIDVANFGTPGDIDGNSKIVLLFTSAVNALTPRNSESYVAGFFFNRDLFPTADTPQYGKGCAGSNYGELFYLLAPDPTGAVNGNVRRTSFVDSVTTSVIAHEFEHLINASRRLYITPGVEDFEVSWMDEGLAHIAEELLFYHESGVSPRANLDSVAIRSAEKVRLAFNNDESSNAARYRDFLIKPSENSPFRDDDSLETRGAAWNLLRYLADQKGGSEATTWQALVKGPSTGITNLTAVFGGDVPARVRDWSVSNYTDDLVSGAPAEFTQPSWNWHSLFKALSRGASFPLEVKALTGGAGSGELIGGSAAYYRFSVPANTTATVTLSTTGPIAARVVRIR